MILPIILLFVYLVFYNISQRNTNRSISFAVVITMILVCIAAFRSPISPDYQNYAGLYDYEHDNKEIGYLALIRFSKLLSSQPVLFFFLSAAISVSLKVFAIRRISPLFSLCLIVYISNVFILHDMIQMRAAISSGLLLWSLYFYCNDDIKKSLLFSCAGVLFHYSAVVGFLIYLLGRKGFNKSLAISLLLVSYVLAILGIRFGNVFGLITWGTVAHLWNTYSELMLTGEQTKINVFNTYFLVRILVCLVLVINYNRIKGFGCIYTVGLKMYVLSICIYLLFSDIPVLAFRLSELFQVVEVFLFSSLIYLFKDKMVGRLLVVTLATAFLLVNLFHNQLVV